MKPYLLLILFVFTLFGCQQQGNVQPSATDEFVNVPTVVVQAVKGAYPTAQNLSFTEIDKSNVWESTFTVQAVNHQAKVNTKGTILEAYAVGSAGSDKVAGNPTLPAAAQTYLDKNYPTHKVIAVGEGQYNNQKAFKVLLRNEKEEVTLIFDGNGVLYLEFKAALTPKTTTTQTDIPKLFPITKADELPAVISKYLTDNGMTFAKGMASVGEGNKKTYLVVATKGTTIYELTFDNDGKLIKSSSIALTIPTKIQEKAIAAASELPALITDYLTKNYPNWVFMKGIVTLNESGKAVSYLVAVKVGETLYYLTFTGEGKFEAVKKG